MRKLSVCLSVCPSVKHVHCDKTEERSGGPNAVNFTNERSFLAFCFLSFFNLSLFFKFFILSYYSLLFLLFIIYFYQSSALSIRARRAVDGHQ